MISLVLVLPLLQAASQPAPERSLVFAWPRVGSVHVREEALVAGVRATTSYLLHWAPEPERRAVRVEYGQHELVEVGGTPASDPSLREEVERYRELVRATPAFIVSDLGELLDLANLDEVRRLSVEYARARGMPQAELEAYAQAVADPGFELSVRRRVGETWQSWVGLLLAERIRLGGVVERTLEIPVTDTQTAYSPRRIQAELVPVEGGKPRVAIRMVASLDAEALRLMLSATNTRVEGVSRVDDLDGVWELETMRPIRVHRRTTIVTRVGQVQRTETEEHSYAFSWPDLAARDE